VHFDYLKPAAQHNHKSVGQDAEAAARDLRRTALPGAGRILGRFSQWNAMPWMSIACEG
jgi:hypothetical protein